ncbi:MAG: putative 2OG-Fe(II) oxygenase [Caulobacter sp.]|nr:putative 2OG-Fe(II) oxygenase [Caulobacter sp.]
MTPETAKILRTGATLIESGRVTEAVGLLSTMARAQPRLPDARRLLGLALHQSGDLEGAERELRAAASLDKRAPVVLVELAATQLALGREAECEKSLRGALARDRRFVPAAGALARYLIGKGRPAEALQVTAPLVAGGDDPLALSVHAEALRALDRLEESIAVSQRIVARPDADQVFVHNLAVSLADAERFEEAERAASRAILQGASTPETWRVRGRALQGMGRYDEAEAVFREALRRSPGFAPAHRDLADLIWMRTGDVAAAGAAVDAAIAVAPTDPALRIVKAKLLDFAGEVEAAYAAILPVVAGPDSDPFADASAAQIIMMKDGRRARVHAERALANAPDNPMILTVAAEASLAAGEPEMAARRALALRELFPRDQQAIGLLATAWRLMDDPRFRELYDYDAFVKTWRLDTPEGWPNLDAWLADMTTALKGMHNLEAHPIGQSLRQGTQTSQSLDRSPDPAIRGLFEGIRGPIQRHIESLGRGRDPLRSRATGRFRLNGSWSVRLKPGGRHVNHMHPKGWLSSACYIALPDAVQNGREGWIGFGEPGIPTQPPLPAEHWVKPEPGMLVLFPSYMWHGTVPFGGDQPRLTCAFDVLPA